MIRGEKIELSEQYYSISQKQEPNASGIGKESQRRPNTNKLFRERAEGAKFDYGSQNSAGARGNGR